MRSKLVPGENDLQTLYPHVATQAYEWDPSTVHSCCNKKLPWLCKHGHVWIMSPANRVLRKGNCHFCSGKRVLKGFNDLATLCPRIVSQAHGWDPCCYTKSSNKRLQWICDKGHIWIATPNQRTSNNSGCPYCSGRYPIKGETDLASMMLWLAKEAHGWDPSTVKPGSSSSKMAWRCPKGHVYEAKVCDRALRGTGCAQCAKFGYKTNETAWIYLLSKENEQKIGITNTWKTRFARHKGNGWRLVQRLGLVGGDFALYIENCIKKWLKEKGYVLSGTRENWLIANLEVSSIAELAGLAGVDGSDMDRLQWLSPSGHPITPDGETPMANRPPITAAIDLTADTLNALRKAGPNERGNYPLDVAVWENEKRSSDRAPSHTGTVKLKGQKDSPKSYASVWVNENIGGAPDDLF